MNSFTKSEWWVCTVRLKIFPQHGDLNRFIMKTDPDEEKAKEAIENLLRKVEVYERLLSKQKYIAGNVRAIFIWATISILIDLLFRD